jgi:hypothetical protein
MPSVTLQLPADTATRLRQKASLDGQSLETYLVRLAEAAALELNGTPATVANAVSINLPTWEGTVLTSLSRRELYDDVN